MVSCRRYNPEDLATWNSFIQDSKMSAFFFLRSFMDYHKDRFDDHSVMFFDEGQLIAVLPANQNQNQLVSHGGLTFGGLVLSRKLRSSKVAEILTSLKEYLLGCNITSVIYKASPHFMHDLPAEEDVYFLFNDGAQLVRRDLTSIIYNGRKLKLSKGRKALISKARGNGVVITESDDITGFYELLSGALEKHGVKPVHSVEELEMLKERHSKNIKLYIAEENGKALAGALMFNFDSVEHTQYLATSDEGKTVGALDLLIGTLIERFHEGESRVFSFGISTENAGKYLNEGLLSQKEGFGARSAVIDFYEWNLNG
ncbi:TPA: GNAT family N-acetyltransferase [Vibrio vulnificus]|uniref:GNAT family N-acetyltransferase n=1 Tax=Vibrio vulnificus TaxID=672 RepID=UPI001DC496B9|nr:GNAT family N-acetyltransferase [Vibrio vulnificus]EHK9184209.1 GNAT family N-acetyltransferase [Vibrio vulnificus]EHZ2755522.1 GNAT family N-acetyltransferase [Vibrio vulnificus]EHZ2763732.1 GNAT family N-acetyltransferase [Vibrio vulnificus]EKD8804198.1 GNAT family N-acetyltransferase [Vibrio vulnificus]EKD9321196.1 GNAT family N-acetyltransferase [Vibrio vulnificus]